MDIFWQFQIAKRREYVHIRIGIETHGVIWGRIRAQYLNRWSQILNQLHSIHIGSRYFWLKISQNVELVTTILKWRANCLCWRLYLLYVLLPLFQRLIPFKYSNHLFTIRLPTCIKWNIHSTTTKNKLNGTNQ